MLAEADGPADYPRPLATPQGGLVLWQTAQGLQVLDLSAVTQVDSAALALLLAWLRSAREAGRSLSIVGAPPALQSLASLYDVDSILPLA